MSTDSAGPADTLTVALTEPVDVGDAPVPANESERLVFGWLYDTLLRMDCNGNAYPGLAGSWSSDSNGRVWTFTLRQGSRLRGGIPLTAQAVSSSWAGRQPESLGIAAAPLDAKRLRLTLARPSTSPPRLLADPVFALAVDTSATKSRVHFQSLSSHDPRDALDRGIDLLVTRDPELVDYVANRPELAALPLPWTRTYVLLQPAVSGSSDLVRDDVRSSLARDAVKAEARTAQAPFWWDAPQCPIVQLSSKVPLPRRPRIVYPEGDEVARGLAERLVALAGNSPQLRTSAAAPTEFAASLRSQEDEGYVLALPRQVTDPCLERGRLPEGALIRPLIDTRAHAIVRRGTAPLIVDWDGTVRFDGQTRTRASE